MLSLTKKNNYFRIFLWLTYFHTFTDPNVPFLSSQSPIPSIDRLDGYVRREAGHSGRRDMEGSVVRNPISGPPSMELRWVARRSRDAKGPPKLPLLLQPPEVVPLYISTNLQHVNTRALRDLYSSCNLSYYRNPNSSKHNSPVEEVDINKLRLALSRSDIVVSVFCKSHHIPSDSNEEKSSKEEPGRITELRDISQRAIPISPFNGELVGFGRAVSDQVLTASIYDVMVIPSLQRMGIGRMIVEKIVRMLTNKGVYDISALCTQKERLFFMACGFGNDVLGSTTMMYARFRPTL